MSQRWTIEDVQRVQQRLPAQPEPAKSKYLNQKTIVDGITFDSKKEAARYGILKLMERTGHISNLRLQVPFRLQVNEILICTYKADFTYEENGQLIVEDVKGIKTKEFILKQKLMLALKGIKIKIV